MTIYTASVRWQRQGAAFTDGRYSRAHDWHFDGGAVVPASSSPQVVRLPYSDPAGVDPEEAMVAALSSCHLLFFLGYAAADGWLVDRYDDDARGVMAIDARGKPWLAEVLLRPQVVFAGDRPPDDAVVDALHHRAHDDCYIANSVRSAVRTEGRWRWQR